MNFTSSFALYSIQLQYIQKILGGKIWKLTAPYIYSSSFLLLCSCMKQKLNDILDIQYSILMAPMFLISDQKMILAALDAGITGAFPAANYRTEMELRKAIHSIRTKSDKPFGINLIVNRSNTTLQQQLEVILSEKPTFVITSLGNPKEVINACHQAGIKVFCDVTDMNYAHKVVDLGADALVAVNRLAGGHPGKIDGIEFCTLLSEEFDVPVIYAGGIAKGEDIDKALSLGAAGVSIGTLFLASEEAPISDEYKHAVVQHTAKDIVTTDKLSGSDLHVINTDYVKKIGTKSNGLTRFLYRHKKLRRYLKALAMKKSMKLLRKSAFSASYNTVWVAGPSIEHVSQIEPVKTQVDNLVKNSTLI